MALGVVFNGIQVFFMYGDGLDRFGSEINDVLYILSSNRSLKLVDLRTRLTTIGEE